MTTKPPVAVITGVGPGTGAALARRFAGGGYAVAMFARTKSRPDALESSWSFLAEVRPCRESW